MFNAAKNFSANILEPKLSPKNFTAKFLPLIFQHLGTKIELKNKRLALFNKTMRQGCFLLMNEQQNGSVKKIIVGRSLKATTSALDPTGHTLTQNVFRCPT